jgi:hypothetical protein
MLMAQQFCERVQNCAGLKHGHTDDRNENDPKDRQLSSVSLPVSSIGKSGKNHSSSQPARVAAARRSCRLVACGSTDRGPAEINRAAGH